MNHLKKLEDRSIFILREAYANFKDLAMLWSVGKDSTVLLWLTKPIRSPSRNPGEIIEELRAGKLKNVAERSGRAQDQDDGGGLCRCRRTSRGCKRRFAG